MFSVFTFSLLLGLANAHLAAWHQAMYCLNGVDGTIDLNSAAPVTPLYQLTKSDWWFHHINKCDQFPPAPGVFLDLPAGGQFQVEIASNRAKTSLSYGGRDMSDWPDGNHYPEDYNIPTCIISPNMHTQNQSMAAGTAFAISYQSDITKVTAENLVVFSVRYHTPWKRVTTYDVPSAMPACPPEGCICAWGWVPNGCGQPNIYHQPYRCRVTNARSTTPVAPGKAPVWCEGHPDQCTKGAKQMIYWHQKDGNNIVVDGWDLAGDQKSPGYNMKTGFQEGAQNDIFAGPPSSNNEASNPNTQPPNGAGGSAPPSGNSTNSGNPSYSPPAPAASPTSSSIAAPVSTSAPQSTAPPPQSNPPAYQSNSAPATQSNTPATPQYSTPPNPPNPPPSCRSKKGKRSRLSLRGGVHKRELHKGRFTRKRW